MINIRSRQEIEKLRKAGQIAARAMGVARDTLKPGITTQELSETVRVFIESQDAKAAFLGYNGFPGAICVSVNEEVVHGIPGDRVLEEGDLVKIDLGTYINGFYSDMARSYALGSVSDEVRDLMKATEESLYLGIAKAVAGNRIGDIGSAVQTHVEPFGYGVTRALVGHGLGRNLWEEPQVPNFGRPGTGPRLRSGMVIAIEPMVNLGTWEVETLEDDWTVITADKSISAHFENTIVVSDGAPEILTLMQGEEFWEKTIQ